MLLPHLLKLVVALCLCTLIGCAATSTPHAPAPDSLAQVLRAGGTPLALEVASPHARGHGSGILVHPRIILTAGHIVPVDATTLTAFNSVDGVGEVVRILRIVPEPALAAGEQQATRPLRNWAIPGHEDDDWALLILSAPFASLDAQPAASLDDSRPVPGDTVLIAGFPFADGGRDPARRGERRTLLATTSVIHAPLDARSSDQRFFGRGIKDSIGHSGASGSPVFSSFQSDPPMLIGIYIGEIGYKFLGVQLSSEMMFRRLPIDAIRSAIASLDRSSSAAADPALAN